MYGNAQQILMQQLQDLIGQANNIMRQASAIPTQESAPVLPQQPNTTQKELRTIQYAHGIEDAKKKQSELSNGESAIVMDDSEAVFYAISKDKDGKSPRKLPIGRFTMEEEPEPPKYVTQNDLADFKRDILEAIKGGNS